MPHLDQGLRPTGAVERHVIVMLRLLYVHAVATARATDGAQRTTRLDQYRRRFDFLRRQYADAFERIRDSTLRHIVPEG